MLYFLALILGIVIGALGMFYRMNKKIDAAKDLQKQLSEAAARAIRERDISKKKEQSIREQRNQLVREMKHR